MKIDLTKKQYEQLLELMYLGEWMANGHKVGAENKYDELEQRVFSYAKNFGSQNLIEYDRELKKSFPTKELEESGIFDIIDDYNNKTFWEELVDRLADRDFVQKYGMEKIEKMSFKERFSKQTAFEEIYSAEFEESGLNNVLIVQRKTTK